MMFFLVLILAFIQTTISFNTLPPSLPSYDYKIPKWAEKAFKHNKLSKTQLNKLKTRMKHKQQQTIICNSSEISEFNDNYNALIACGLPLGLLQNKSYLGLP